MTEFADELKALDPHVVVIEKLPERPVVFLEFPDDIGLDEEFRLRIEGYMRQCIPGCQIIVLVGCKLVGIYEGPE